MPDDAATITWKKLISILAPIITLLFAIACSILALLWQEVKENRIALNEIRDALTDLKVQQASEYGKLGERAAKTEITLQNVSQKIDAITYTRLRGDDHE